MAPFRVLRNGHPVSVWLPTYPALAAPFLAWLGTPGLSVPAALGVGACAGLIVVWLAPALGLSWAVSGGLALVLSTPLFFYGLTVWEHSLGLALCLGAWIAVARPTRRRLALAGALIALGCTLRSELALMGIALAVSLYALRRQMMDLVVLALGALPIAVALLVFQLAVYGHALGPHVSGTVLGEAFGGASSSGAFGVALRWVRTLISLSAGYGANGAEALMLGSCASVVVVAGFAAVLHGGTYARVASMLAVVAALAAWALGLARILGADDPLGVLVRYNGMLVQLPLAGLAGVGAARAWRAPQLASIAPGLLAGAIFLALGLALGAATPFSSGIHWGPRVLMPAFPLLVALALITAREGDVFVHLGFGALFAAGLLSSGVAVWLLGQQLREGERLAATLLASPEPVVVTSHELLAQQLAQIWERKPMLLARDPAALEAVVHDLEATGAGGFLLLVPPGHPHAAGVRGARCELRAEQRGQYVKYLDLDVLACKPRS